jgi:hypothetical protein
MKSGQLYIDLPLLAWLIYERSCQQGNYFLAMKDHSQYSDGSREQEKHESMMSNEVGRGQHHTLFTREQGYCTDA